ncbi:MAG TPA: hypothetical protein VGL42_14710 [Opitutaceae bacterium]
MPIKKSLVSLTLLALVCVGAKADTIGITEIDPFTYDATFSFDIGSGASTTFNGPAGPLQFVVGGGFDDSGDEGFGFFVAALALGGNGVGSSTFDPAGTLWVDASDGESWATDRNHLFTLWGAQGTFDALYGADTISGTGVFVFNSVLSYPDYPDQSVVITNQIPALPDRGNVWAEAAAVALFFALAGESSRNCFVRRAWRR